MKGKEYNKVAKFYDDVIGKDNNPHSFIRSRINAYNKNAKTILELGCGTGSNLEKLVLTFEVTGIDLSEEMISIAKKKIPSVKFHLDDMRSFRLNRKFDVIICMYDTINHLTLFSDWKRVFANVSEHLIEKGLFIFDINTLYKLNYISVISPLVYVFRSGYLIVDIKKTAKNVFNWNLKIFENKNKSKNNFRFHEVNIKESSFDINKIVTGLEKYFIIKKIEEENLKKINSETERAYFICMKK